MADFRPAPAAQRQHLPVVTPPGSFMNPLGIHAGPWCRMATAGSCVSVHYPLAQRAQGMLAPNSPLMA